jgi:hypothetical protein
MEIISLEQSYGIKSAKQHKLKEHLMFLLATSFPNPLKSRVDIFLLHEKFICKGNFESQGALFKIDLWSS